MAERSTKERPSSGSSASHHPSSAHSSNPPSHASTPSVDAKSKDAKAGSFFQSLFRGPGIRNGSSDSISMLTHARKAPTPTGLVVPQAGKESLGMNPTAGNGRKELPVSPLGLAFDVMETKAKRVTLSDLEERMRAVEPSAFAGLSIGEKVEAVQDLERYVGKAINQGRSDKERASTESLPSDDDAISPLTPIARRDAVGLEAPSLLIPWERLIHIALRISAMDQAIYKQKLRLCGYRLLVVILAEETTRGLPLGTTVQIAKPLLSALSLAKSSSSYSLLEEISCRLSALVAITREGADITSCLDFGLVRVVMDWINLVKAEWIVWGGQAGDMEGDAIPGDGNWAKEHAGLGIFSPPAPRPFNLPSNDSRDPSPTSTRLEPLAADLCSPDTTLATLLSFLLSILRHNFPLFYPFDIDHIIAIYSGLLEAGIQACQESALATSPVGPELTSRSRSLSTSLPRTARRSPSRSKASESRSDSQHSGTLSRGPSVKRQAAGGFSVPVATVPLPQISKAIDAADDFVRRVRPRWTTMLESFIACIRTCLASRAITPLTVPKVVRAICRAAGSTEGESNGEAREAVGELLQDMLCDVVVGRSTERALRTTADVGDLGGENAPDSRTLTMAQGAVILIRFVLQRSDDLTAVSKNRAGGPTGMFPSSLSFHSLAACLTKAIHGCHREARICAEVLGIVQDRLAQLQSGELVMTDLDASVPDLRAEQSVFLDAWSEGDAICSVLRAFSDTELPGVILGAKGSSAEFEGQATSALVSARFYDIIERLPLALGTLQSSSTNPVFWHPELVALLMSMSSRLSSDFCKGLIDHHRAEGLCLPGCTGWKRNATKLLEVFFEQPQGDTRPQWSQRAADEAVVRVSVARLIFKDTYDAIKDFSATRRQFGTEVVLPALERSLAYETNAEISKWLWEILVSLAARETIEQDEARRQAETLDGEAPGSLTQAPLGPPEPTGKLFMLVRALLLRLARQSVCIAKDGEPMRPMSPSGDSEETASNFGIMSGHLPSRDHSVIADNRRALTGSPAPISAAEGTTEGSAPHGIRPGEGREHVHTRCPSLHACNTMIALFTRLAFSMPHALITSNDKYARLPASASCITLFDDMLRLLAPNIGHISRQEMTSASCTQARLSILQWLMRLRANTQHRIWVKPGLDDQAMAPATIFSRLRDQTGSNNGAEEVSSRRRAPRNDAFPMDRGRDHRVLPDIATGRSRSRSRQPAAREPKVISRIASKPMWYIPDELSFELPADARPSEGMTTYDPAGQASVRAGTRTARSGVWLKISKYIEVLMAILSAESDWELVSYTLAFLPFQLANKHFFCGPSSAEWLRALRKQLCEGLAEDKIASQAVLPAGVRRTDVRAVTYQTLTVLISYKRLYEKRDLSRMMEAFVRGLSGGHTVMAKPCVQALTLAAYELQDGLVTHIPSILESLINAMTSRELSAHILEFLFAVGQAPALYQNFTEAQYQSVFKIAVSYIQVHNDVRARQDASTEDEDFTLSQHVIGLSYFCIYVWFIAVGLGRRPKYVTYLTRNIIAAFPDHIVDEMAEVCFDWLSRYTYGNADPRPAVDPMEPIVFGDGKDYPAKHWILGNGIITLQTQPQTGWTKITMRRASGTVVLLAKVQNVPVVGLGEENADLYLEPAVLERSRSGNNADRPAVTAPVTIASESVNRAAPVKTHAVSGSLSKQSLLLSSSPTDRFAVASPGIPAESEEFSFIWAGSTPSQRRKTVLVDPGFIGLQLSAYPYVSLDSPRGRLIPAEANVEKTLVMLDRTPVIDDHKVAILYVGPGQTTEQEILANRDGSPSFLRFVAGLGRLVRLKGQKDVYPGGLDTLYDEDGEYAYAWWDDLAQVVFHTPHLMPNEEVEGGRIAYNNAKKRHVGNDKVKVVFNDSGHDYAFDTIRCQFNFVNIIISSHTSGVSGAFNDSAEHDFFKVTIQKVKGIPEFSAVGEMKLVSAAALPTFIRQLVMLADLMVSVHENTVTSGRAEYVSAWRHRHRTIANLRTRLGPVADTANMTETEKLEYTRDFTRGF